jgi:(R,R)-butanediol dehydrogenase / meso-butanediol dehydrogenase / diacetyl reductase
MRQIMLHGPGDWRLDDVPVPDPGPRDALVRIEACGICGTDVSYVRMGGFAGQPIPLGHEMAGEVAWVGAEVPGIGVGDRVIVCPSDVGNGPMGTGGPQGGLTPLLHVPGAANGRRLFRVPDGMPLKTAALAEPLAVGMQAVNQSDAGPGDRVVVFGCGPIGLMSLATLADRGVEDVVAIDLSPSRLELARDVGASHTLDPTQVDVWEELKRIHGTAPFMFGPTAATDVFIEASGADTVLGDVLGHGRVGGRLVVVALHYRPVPTNYVDVLMKQFTIRGSMEYPDRFEDAVDLLSRRDLSTLITHTMPLERFGDGLELLSGSKDCGKVMITFEDADEKRTVV